MYTNEAIMAFINKGEYEINTDYLYHMCKGIDWFEGTNKAVLGLTLNKATMSEKEIEIPPLEVQLQVVAVLDKMDELIALRKEQLAKLDELVKSRFIELFGDLHSTKFPKCKMAEICNIKHGYAFSGEFFTEEDNNILLVTPGNFKVGGGFQEKKCKFFMGEYSEEYVLNCGDLIVTMTDLSKNMDSLGYSAIVPSTNRVYLHNQRIGLFVDMSENINKVFLMYFMQTNEYRDSIITSATGSTVHHTSPSKILDCDVFLPPIELQDQFAAFVEQTDKSKLAIQQSLDKLELLKKSLMQEYFG
jgi:type I restriction enzyme S subunit